MMDYAIYFTITRCPDHFIPIVPYFIFFLSQPQQISLSHLSTAPPIQFVGEPFHRPRPLPLDVHVGVEQVLRRGALPEEVHEQFDALVGALLIVGLGSRNRVKQAFPGAVVV